MTVCLQQRFTNEDHLAVHKHKHEMTLRFGPARNDSVIIAGESEKSAVRNKSKWTWTIITHGFMGYCCRPDTDTDPLPEELRGGRAV